MERLTEKRDGQNVIPLRQNGKIKWSICSAGLGDAPTEYLYGDHADRLAAIEDILGDEYDLDRLSVMVNQCMTMREEVAERFSLTAKIPLDRLRELVELYSNVPHICDYCIGCEIEPTDGHGCDGYDNFVFSVRRIVAALKAREQDGNNK